MRDPNKPITIATFGDLHRNGNSLHVTCNRCRRCERVDLAKLPQEQGFVGAKFKCRECGSNDSGMSIGGNSKLGAR